MSLFDQAKSHLDKFTSPSPKQIHGRYVKEQQSGCGIRIYHQQRESYNNRTKTDLYFEIRDCLSSRSIRDVGGSFSFTLLPTAPWDEIIQPDDFLRIFMGDLVSSKPDDSNEAFYNFASGDLKIKSSPSIIPSKSNLSIPVPGAGPLVSGGKISNQMERSVPERLIMYERMLGKVDRIEKITRRPGRDQGTVVGYQVTGRSFGAILQDLSIYYSEFIPGMNAISAWWGTLIKADDKRPDEMVSEFLNAILTLIPMPQWQLPPALIDDLTDPLSYRATIENVTKTIFNALDTIRASLTSVTGIGTATAFARLTTLINDARNNINTSPLTVISLKGIKNTHGRIFDNSFMNNVSGGALDFIKYLSNAAFNEFWMDLCPDGDPEKGKILSSRSIPTVVMRQRPFDIPEEMVSGLSEHTRNFMGAKYVELERVNISDVSKSMLDIIDQSITVVGPVATTEGLSDIIGNSRARNIASGSISYTPTLLDYHVGLSGHERYNGFVCLGSFPSGRSSMDQDKLLLSEEKGFYVDTDSIKRFGFRMLEVSTPYAAPNRTSSNNQSHIQTMKEFSGMLANWYFLNPVFLNGRMVCRFMPEARVGVPCTYIETRVTPDNPYPKAELSYIQGVADQFQAGKLITTTLTVTRGLRYDLTAESNGGDIFSTLTGALGGLA